MDGFQLRSTAILLLIIVCSYAHFSSAQVTLPNFPQTKPFLFPQTKPFFFTTAKVATPPFTAESANTNRIESSTTRTTRTIPTMAKYMTSTTTTKYTYPTTTKYTYPSTSKYTSPTTPTIVNYTSTMTTKCTSTTKPSVYAAVATTNSTANSTGNSSDGLALLHSDSPSGSNSSKCSKLNGCGVSSQDKVIGGTLASPHEFPWLAHLIISKGSRSALCTGFLVTNRHVITAAHCTKGSSDGSVQLIIGTNSPSIGSSSTNDKDAIQLRSVKIVVHPQYDEHSNMNDVSVITVDKSITFMDTVRPICLPVGDESYAGSMGIIAGWGSISEGGAVTKRLMKANVPILNNGDPICVKAYGNTLTPQMICAGGEHMDTCQGDSGGPLMVSSDGIFTAIGIVSFGIGCGRPSTPGVYARITSLKPFIDLQISSEQTCDNKNNTPNLIKH